LCAGVPRCRGPSSPLPVTAHRTPAGVGRALDPRHEPNIFPLTARCATSTVGMRNHRTARPSVRAFRSSYSSTVPTATFRPNPSCPINYRLKSVSFRVHRDVNAPNPQLLTSPKAVADLVTKSGIIADDGREHFGILLLDTRLKLIAYHEVAVGTVDSVRVSPRDVFGPALRVLGTARLILVHNHPSGDVAPSRHDRALTKQLIKAGKLLDIEVDDHVIIGSGSGRWFSFCEGDLIQGE
jgi:hypothetical protein